MSPCFMPRCAPSTLHTLSHLIPPTALAISYYLYPHFSDKNAKTGAQSPVILSSAIQGEEGQGYIHVPGGTWRRREGRWPGRETEVQMKQDWQLWKLNEGQVGVH